MTVSELFAKLREREIHVWIDGDRVRCNAPRGALTPDLQEEIKRNRVDLIRYLQTVTTGGGETRHLSPIPPGEQAPLSFFQERLWILNRLEPHNTAYNLVATLNLKAPVDLALLETSLNRVIQRHEALRCAFRETGGVPTVAINPASELRPEMLDLRQLSAAEQEAEVNRAVSRETTIPFHLEQGNLVRVSCAILGDNELTLIVAMHHIITDAWSTSILLQEWSAVYLSLQHGQPAPLQPVEVQFPAYAYWERRWLRESALDAHLEYWKTRLADAPNVLTLPSDRPRPAVQSYQGGLEGFVVPADLADRLRARCREEGVTVFMTLLATFNVLLQRYSGQNDLLVGSPIAIRNHPELERTIGPFVNSLVLRTQIAPDDTSRTLRARVRQTVLEGQAHQDVPFGRVIELINPERSLAYSPLFQVAFMFQNSPGRSAFTLNTGGSMYDLTLNGWEIDGTIGASFEYASALFDAATVARMARHFVVLLAGMVEHPDCRLADLPVLTPAEREEVLSEWNATARPYPSDETLADMFEHQSAGTPDRSAVVSERGSWTYQELNRRANQLAHHLRRRGVGQGQRVAVCLERSPRLLQALLGVVKSGASYVPIDPQYPQKRIDYMLADAGVALILTEEQAKGTLGAVTTPLLCLDTEESLLGNESGENPDAHPGPDDPAYVIYTSGSTGQPKGVEISHGALANLLRSMREEPGLDERDTLLAITTVAFDISGLELYLPLVTGARLFLAGTTGVQNGRALQKLLKRSGATIMQATPATWQMLVDIGWKGGDLVAWCGGDTLSRDLAEALLKRTRAVWNLYGPTETTIWSTTGRVISEGGAVLIGRPIANTQVYIVDANLQPLPIGAAGEIYIGGRGVARGYLGRPQLTTERFIADPFSLQPGSRLYRTGDLGRLRPDGQIEHLGRVDHQIKLRGFRIELGEIEAVLAAHPSVITAVAAVRNARLVAYVVTEPGSVLTTTDARRFLRDRLPDYMIPMLVTTLDQMPLTANGKIDRRALPDPFVGTAASDMVAPETVTEQAIARLWQELLGVGQVSVNRSFFEQGGHSLLAVKAAYEIEKLVGKPFDVRPLFFETLRQIAARIDGVAAPA